MFNSVPHLVFNAPGVCVSGSKKLSQGTLKWHPENSELDIDISSLSFPLAVVFHITLSLPDIKQAVSV